MTSDTTDQKTQFTLRLSFKDNPIILKELRSRMRGRRAFILITVYLILLGGLVGLFYLGYAAAETTPGSEFSSNNMGRTIFGAVFGLELMMVIFIAPAMTAGAISSERERLTLDLLRSTLLSPRMMIVGKLISALSFLLLLLIVAFPLQSLAYLSGGVTLEELFIAFLILIVTAFAYSAIALFISSINHRTLASTVISYLLVNALVFGLPIFFYIIFLFLNRFMFTSDLINITSAQQTLVEIVTIVIAWILISTNPIATAIASEIILIENQSALSTNIPLSNGTNIMVISPWIGYVIISLLISALLIFLSIVIIRRVDK